MEAILSLVHFLIPEPPDWSSAYLYCQSGPTRPSSDRFSLVHIPLLKSLCFSIHELVFPLNALKEPSHLFFLVHFLPILMLLVSVSALSFDYLKLYTGPRLLDDWILYNDHFPLSVFGPRSFFPWYIRVRSFSASHQRPLSRLCLT